MNDLDPQQNLKGVSVVVHRGDLKRM